MRLIFIRQNYPPEKGSVRYIRDLAEAMAERGHEVTVITGLPNYPTGKPYPGFGYLLPDVRIENHGVKVIRTPLVMASNTRPFIRLASFISFAFTALIAALLQSRPDVIVSSVPPVTVAPLGLLLSLLKRVPLVMMIHDFEPLRSLELRGMMNNGLSKIAVAAFTRLYQQADKIVVTIETELEAMLEWGAAEDKIEVVTHGIDIERFCAEMTIRSKDESIKRSGRSLALYVGTIGVAHDVEKMIECFATPEVRGLPVDLVVIGDGECAPVCLDLVKQNQLDNVRILPPVNLDKVPGLLLEADLLVCSQKPNLFSVGSKFYEYLAAAKPLLANSTGILSRKVREIGNGWVFRADCPETLLKALQEFLACPLEERANMGRAGKEYAKNNYSAVARHDKWEQMLVELA